MKFLTIKWATRALFAASSTILSSPALLGQGAVQSSGSSQPPTLQPRVVPGKSASVSVSALARQDLLAVKFKQARKMRAYGGRVYDMSTKVGASPVDLTSTHPTLSRLNAYWYPMHHKSTEAQLDALRALAEANTGAEMPDLNATMLVTVPVGISAQDLANQINAADEVEYVESVLIPSLTAPDLSSKQDYLHGLKAPSTRFGGLQAGGINADYVWNTYNNRGMTTSGTKIKVAVIELGANLSHVELGGVVLAGGNPDNNPFTAYNSMEHGTATTSIIKGRSDGVGINGIANQCKLYLVQNGSGGGDPTIDALNIAYNTVGVGGIINASQGYVVSIRGKTVQLPLTFSRPVWELILSYNQSGCICVLSAGNSGVLIDEYDQDTNHNPFGSAGSVPGLIYVGAGAMNGSGQVARSRCQFNPTSSSNYGTYVSVQGPGNLVEAAGMTNIGANYTGGAYSAEGENYAYTEAFNGTSAAAPVVAGAAALLQAVSLQQSGVLLTPNQLKKKLKKTGAPQTDGIYPATQKIGRLPNLKNALFYLLPPATQASTAPQPEPEEDAYTPAYNYTPYKPYGQEEP